MAIEAKIYNQKGEVTGKIDLPGKVFSAPWRADLVHQVVESMRSNKRSGTAFAKDRGVVSGGGRKPWKQKGTGRARHGSSRSPIWVGGGITHGPTLERTYKRIISKKMRREALFSVLSKKYKDGEIIFIDSLAPKEIKTKDAVEMIKNITNAVGLKGMQSKRPKVLAALQDRNERAEKSLRNLPQIEISFLKNLNPLDVLNRKYLFIEGPDQSVKFLESR